MASPCGGGDWLHSPARVGLTDLTDNDVTKLRVSNILVGVAAIVTSSSTCGRLGLRRYRPVAMIPLSRRPPPPPRGPVLALGRAADRPRIRHNESDVASRLLRRQEGYPV
jgi:hypothetical protein